jgi:hypothetical protein
MQRLQYLSRYGLVSAAVFAALSAYTRRLTGQSPTMHSSCFAYTQKPRQHRFDVKGLAKLCVSVYHPRVSEGTCAMAVVSQMRCS